MTAFSEYLVIAFLRIVSESYDVMHSDDQFVPLLETCNIGIYCITAIIYKDYVNDDHLAYMILDDLISACLCIGGPDVEKMADSTEDKQTVKNLISYNPEPYSIYDIVKKYTQKTDGNSDPHSDTPFMQINGLFKRICEYIIHDVQEHYYTTPRLGSSEDQESTNDLATIIAGDIRFMFAFINATSTLDEHVKSSQFWLADYFKTIVNQHPEWLADEKLTKLAGNIAYALDYTGEGPTDPIQDITQTIQEFAIPNE